MHTLREFFNLVKDLGMDTDVLNEMATMLGKRYWTVGASASELLYLYLQRHDCAGHEIVVPNWGCHSIASAVVRAQAIPVFVDIGSSLVVTVDDISKALSLETKVVIVVEQYGIPCDYIKIRQVLDSNVTLIADISQSWGARACGYPSGYGADAVLISFGPGKPLSVGGGGAVFTDRQELLIDEGTPDFRNVDTLLSAARFPPSLRQALPEALRISKRNLIYRQEMVERISADISDSDTQLVSVPRGYQPAWTRVPFVKCEEHYRRYLSQFGLLQYPHSKSVSELPLFERITSRRIRRPEQQFPLLLKLNSAQMQ